MDEKKTAFELCLTCPIKTGFVIRDSGWWKPMCMNWNSKKTDNRAREYYGPKESCIYKLEHLILDERKEFKIRDINLYLYFLNYIDKKKMHMHINKYKDLKTQKEYTSLMFLELTEVVKTLKKSYTIENLVGELNYILMENDIRCLGRHFKYHQIKKESEQWVLELIDARKEN